MPTTTYMVLSLPAVEVTLGPAWASMLNTAIEGIDEHDHTTGKGKQVPAAGLNINEDLSFGSHNATALKSARFTSQSAALGGVSDLSCLYDVNGDLYWNTDVGTQIQLTSGGSLNVSGLSVNYYSRLSVTTNLVIGAADTDVHYDVNTTAARTITLPAAAGVTPGRFYIFKDISGQAATNPITVQTTGGDTIQGAATTVQVGNNYGSLTLVSDGTSAWRLHRFSDPSYLNGASVPAGAGLTTGNVLKASGATSLSYGAVDLGGGAGHVTGLLPWANIVSPVPLAHLTDATTLAKGIVQLAQDLGGTAAAPAVVALTGAAGTLPLRSGLNTIEFATGATNPTIKAATAGAAPTTTYLQGQAAGAGGGGNHSGGPVVVRGGAPDGTGAPGSAALAVSTGDVLVGAAAFSATRRVATLAATGPVTTDVPAGDLVVYVGNAATAPSTSFGSQNPVSGFVFYGTGGQPTFKLATGSTIQIGERSSPASIGNTGTIPITTGNAALVLDVVVNGSTYKLPLYNA